MEINRQRFGKPPIQSWLMAIEDIISDSGSSENFLAIKIVTTIKEICTVPLSIESSYKDQIVCDVLDMDVCHLLLGRPWQHDT